MPDDDGAKSSYSLILTAGRRRYLPPFIITACDLPPISTSPITVLIRFARKAVSFLILNAMVNSLYRQQLSK
jgi:hypothetical protein